MKSRKITAAAVFTAAIFFGASMPDLVMAQAATLIPPAQCLNLGQNLKFNMSDVRGKDVRALQQFLKDGRYFGLEPTGYFGKITEDAVKRFQKDNGVPATGLVGPLTRAKVLELSCGRSRSAITVTSPKLGDVWQVGTTHSVSWQSNLPPSFAAHQFSVSVRPMSQNLKNVSYLIAQAITTDSFFWTVGKDLNNANIPDGDYAVEVCVKGDASTCTRSGKFRISLENVGLISIISPSAGDAWTIGESRRIVWNRSNMYVPTVEILLKPRAASRDLSFVVADSAPNSGSYVWTVGKIQNQVIGSGEYGIEICEGKGSARACGTSDAFSVKTSTTTNAEPIVFTVTTNKKSYGRFEDIQITVTAKNITAKSEMLTFSSGCQASYAVGTFDYTKDRACTMVFGTLELPPFESRSWYFVHRLSENPLSPGAHTLTGNILGSGQATTSVTIFGTQ